MGDGRDRTPVDRIVRRVQDDERISEAVVAAVVDATNEPLDDETGPRKPDVLYDTVDPDALDGVFRGGADGRLAFYFAGAEIVVEGGNRVIVTPLS